MSAHTPGPWVLIASNPERDGADCWTLLAQPHPGLRGFTRELAILAGPTADKNAHANARLIVAAPDLLKALQSLTDACGDVRPFKGEVVDPGKDKLLDSKRAIDFMAAVDAANHAIAKATGAA